MPAVKDSSSAAADIIDIRGEQVDFNIKEDVVAQMNPIDGPRSLPTLLLYDEKGLQLFENITYLDEYYLTNQEIKLLETHSREIAKTIPDGSIVVELGSGNLRKVCLLLGALEQVGKKIDYYALDLSEEELQRTLANVPDFRHVHCHGLLGTYDDGREWLRQFASSERHVCVLHLGSSIGNFNRDDAADFLHSFANVLKNSDSLLIGIDSCSDPDKVYHAYNDKEGVTHQFILNGLHHANEIFGKQVFHIPDWQVIGEYVYDEDGGRHQAFLSPKHETCFDETALQAHERVKIEQSLKYSQIGAEKLWKMSGFTEAQHWRLGDDYGLHLLKRAQIPFSTIPERYAASSLPTIQDWESLWASWDIVTKGMLPDQDLQEKPIKLRNACIFYLGHIPTFLDIQIHKTTKLPPTEPASFYKIFERGIDPDVDNPERCHDHSEIPEEWPPVVEIEAFQERVRERLRKLYEGKISRDVGRAIWVGFEHEVMHMETLLYMMLQSDRTMPPPHTGTPDFAALAEKARMARVPNQWVDVPEQTITLGMDDPENIKESDGYYGWDNEKPARQTTVHGFQSQARPITNEEYAQYLHESNISKLPSSWASDPSQPNGTSPSFIQGKSVRTVYGLVPLKYALDWPVFASYDELSGCAAWMGGRIPTMEETKSIYAYVDRQKERFTRSKLANNVPAVNAHLVNDGVEETPPSNVSVDEARSNLFIDLSGANVGFRHWHPQPITSRGSNLVGQGEMGGVWEWTSSPLTRHEGFEPMELYPAYTADFFDGKHNVVLGGSWATHPRIAGRKSFVNWYQTNYPFAWAGARVVRDAQIHNEETL